LDLKWLGANPDVELIVEDKDEHYHSYSHYTKEGEFVSNNHIASWKKLTYKNIYPNIDVVYEIHPRSGFKYSVLVHSGGDISKVQLKYSKKINLNVDGTISTATKFGDVIDHKPVTFYSNNKNSTIQSKYKVEGNVISFDIANYDKTKSILIDPWTQMPNFPSSNWDCVWECERDGAGNVYVIGGTSPMQLLKYDVAGTLQWTYNTPYDTTSWLGTFATDLAGNSYVSNGSPVKLMKIDNAASVVWNNTNPGGLLALTEFWNITFNCDQTKLIIGGTDGFLSPLPYIFDIDMTTGNVLTSVQMHGAGSFLAPQEVRSITPCNNGKYYFLSHDSIGWIHQSLTTCTPGTDIFRTGNGIGLSYKCEDWRYNNSGIMALAHYGGFVFVHKGDELQKRDFATAAVVATVTIPGGLLSGTAVGDQVGCSGIDIDDCGNIFVGSTNGIYKFNQALLPSDTFTTVFTVYDVEVNLAGDIIAGGSTGNSGSGSRTGYIQSFAATACAPQAIVCCDATICYQGSLCLTDTAVAIPVIVPGGTYSASCGACIDSVTGVFNALVAGVGNHTITYSFPCGSESITVPVNQCTSISVCEELNGSLTVSGGTGPYNWSEWFPGGSTPITNQTECVACGYTWVGLFCLDGIAPVTTCVTPAGWVPLATGPTIPPPSTYPVQVVDNAGTTSTISGPGTLLPCSGCAPLTVSTSAQVNVSCFGDSTASFGISATGGTGPYNYVLMNGSIPVDSFINATGTQTFSNLPAGNYIVNVLDSNACPGTTAIVITTPSLLTVAVDSVTNSNCAANSGSIQISPIDGTPNYSYLWSNGSTLEDATGLGAGAYQVTLTDANGCSVVSNSVTITEPSGMTVSLDNTTNEVCGLANGGINMTIAGGTVGYTYLWSNGMTSEDITGLSANTYQLTITDGSGCAAISGAIIITDSSSLLLHIDSVQATACHGGADGFINVSISGGTAGYTYLWSNGMTSEDQSGLVAAVYQVTATDAIGCTVTSASLTITEPSSITVTVDNSSPVSCGASDGTVSISVLGGTVAYSYLWTGGLTSEDITGLSTSGNYDVTVTDANACTATATAIVGSISGMTATATIANILCDGGNSGSINVTITGATMPYTYLWSNAATSQNISGLTAGLYTVSVTDAIGCFFEWDTTLTSAPNMTLTVDSSDVVSCVGGADGQLSSTVVGGTSPYSYLWSNGAVVSTASGLTIGTYSLTVTDANACTVSASGTILDANLLTVGINLITDTLDCDQNPIGALTAAGNGGVGGFSYLWSTAATDANLTGLTAGNYSVTVTDNNGCTSTTAATVYTLFVPTINPYVDAVGQQSTLITQGDSVLLFAGNDQTANGVTYSWSASSINGGDVGFSNTNLPNTSALPNMSDVYSLTVTATSADSCFVLDTLSILVQSVFDGMPNAFSPNGDGVNETLRPVGLTSADILEFKVFNRFGQVVYDNTDIDAGGWDGKYLGVPQPTEVYVFLLRYKLLGQSEKILKGEVTLIR